MGEVVLPGELEKLCPVHEATVVLVDCPEGERGLVALHGVRLGSGALTLPPRLLRVVSSPVVRQTHEDTGDMRGGNGQKRSIIMTSPPIIDPFRTWKPALSHKD